MPKGRKKVASLGLTRAKAGDSFMARIPRWQMAFTCALVWAVRAFAKPLPKSNKILANLLWSLSLATSANELHDLTNGTMAIINSLRASGANSILWARSAVKYFSGTLSFIHYE